MKPEKTLGAEQRFRIDWDGTVTPDRTCLSGHAAGGCFP